MHIITANAVVAYYMFFMVLVEHKHVTLNTPTPTPTPTPPPPQWLETFSVII